MRPWNSIGGLAGAALLATLLPHGLFAQPEPGRGPQPPSLPGTPEPQAVKETPQAPLREEKTGTFDFADGMRLRLSTDIGNVKLITQGPEAKPGKLSYRVVLEADPGHAESAKLLKRFAVLARATPEGVTLTGHAPWKQFYGRLWVSVEVTLPRYAHVEVQTQAGNIEAHDIDGKTFLFTAGGNIFTGKLGGSGAGAKLETYGGHITIADVGGSLSASTGGGHVTAGNVQGDVWLKTGGGHLRLSSVTGTAQLETGGGNIIVQRANAKVVAVTSGGKIDFGSVSGGIRARTGGGGIRVAQVAGPTDLQTAAGSIYLTRVSGTVNASTSAGGITAWFVAESKGQGTSLLACGQGDIVVYLPLELAVTIDATIGNGAEYRIDADPTLPIKFVTSPSDGSGTVRVEGALNGGGQVLRLRTGAGNIRLRDAGAKKVSPAYAPLPPVAPATSKKPRERESGERQHQLHLREMERQTELNRELAWMKQEVELSKIEEWQRKLKGMLGGPVKVPAEEQKGRLIESPSPLYPERARWERVQGIVHLELHVDREGTVKDIRVVAGHPLLAQSATDAVRRWKYAPLRMDGKPVAVMTSVHIEFKMR